MRLTLTSSKNFVEHHDFERDGPTVGISRKDIWNKLGRKHCAYNVLQFYLHINVSSKIESLCTVNGLIMLKHLRMGYSKHVLRNTEHKSKLHNNSTHCRNQSKTVKVDFKIVIYDPANWVMIKFRLKINFEQSYDREIHVNTNCRVFIIIMFVRLSCIERT